MSHKTRLGPLAIFLAVVVMVITTMALLTIATSNADRAMARRFAAVTQTRYKLEADGERFISEAADAGIAAEDLPNAEGVGTTERGYRFYEELDGYSITVEITAPDEEGRYELLEWKVSKLWNASDPVQDIWQGN